VTFEILSISFQRQMNMKNNLTQYADKNQLELYKNFPSTHYLSNQNYLNAIHIRAIRSVRNCEIILGIVFIPNLSLLRWQYLCCICICSNIFVTVIVSFKLCFFIDFTFIKYAWYIVDIRKDVTYVVASLFSYSSILQANNF